MNAREPARVVRSLTSRIMRRTFLSYSAIAGAMLLTSGTLKISTDTLARANVLERLLTLLFADGHAAQDAGRACLAALLEARDLSALTGRLSLTGCASTDLHTIRDRIRNDFLCDRGFFQS